MPVSTLVTHPLVTNFQSIISVSIAMPVRVCIATSEAPKRFSGCYRDHFATAKANGGAERLHHAYSSYYLQMYFLYPGL
jgi:hypothetical protein